MEDVGFGVYREMAVAAYVDFSFVPKGEQLCGLSLLCVFIGFGVYEGAAGIVSFAVESIVV